MVAGSILPVCIYKNKLHFLFGKENKKENSAKGWSDFGGSSEGNETPYQTALREGMEESSGFINPIELAKKGVYKIVHGSYHIFIVKMEYDAQLPFYFKRMHQFVANKMPELLNTVLFEKQELQWFSIDDVIKRRSEFRLFYREITDLFVQHKNEIIQFINAKNAKQTKNAKVQKIQKQTKKFKSKSQKAILDIF